MESFSSMTQRLLKEVMNDMYFEDHTCYDLSVLEDLDTTIKQMSELNEGAKLYIFVHPRLYDCIVDLFQWNDEGDRAYYAGHEVFVCGDTVSFIVELADHG